MLYILSALNLLDSHIQRKKHPKNFIKMTVKVLLQFDKLNIGTYDWKYWVNLHFCYNESLTKDKLIEESVIPPDIELTKKHFFAPSESSYAKEYSQRMSLYFSDAQKTIDTKLRIQQSEVILSSIHSLSSPLQLKIINESVNKEVLILLSF